MERFDINNSNRLREIIDKAIEDHYITREEYDRIIHVALEDGHIDAVERALLAELQQMIEDKMIRFRKA